MASTSPRRRWPLVVAAIVGAIVVVCFVALLALDSIILSQVHKQTDALSRELGRPIVVDGVRTRILGGLGVRVTGVQIGAAAGESLPLLTLQRAEVKADLLKALRTRGREVDVREAVLDGLRVNVEKLRDGTTNAQRFADALEKRSPPKKPEEPKKETDLSFLRVGRAAVEGARISFVDRTIAGAPEVAVSDLGIEVRDLAAGQPLEVVLQAAVIAPQRNLEVRLKAAPLPPSLTPTPTALTVRAQPIDLAPIAPFVPASVGFRGGRFEADLDALLGALVPGGEGPSRLKGGFKATALQFAAQEGGKPLDLVFQSDATADVSKGSADITSLRLDAGPAHLAGHGKVTDFLGSSPRVEGLEIVGTGLDPELLAAYWPPLKKQLAGRIAGPIGLQVRGGGTQQAQTIDVRLDLAPVRLDVPKTLAKSAGAPLLATARLRALGGGGSVAFDATLDAAGVDLRPGGSIAKKPGDPLSVSATGTWKRAGQQQQLELSRLDVVILGDRLAGQARATLAGTKAKPTTTFDAELTGPSLDLDRLLIPTPENAPKKKSEPMKPETFAGLQGEARARLGVLRYKKVDARNVVARVRVNEDQVTLEEARLDVLGGTVSAAGTQVHLASPQAPFKIAAELKGLAADQGTALLWDRKVVSGTLDGRIDLAGNGFEPGQIAKAATGALAGALHGGAFNGADLLASITGPIASKLPFAGNRLTDGGATALGKDLGFEFKLDGGMARLAKPLQVNRPDTQISLGGGVRLDGTLDMPGTLSLTPDLIARLTGGRARPANAIPITFRLSGPAWKPTVGDMNLEAAIQAIAKEAATGAAARALGIKGGDVQGAAQAKQAELQARANAEKAAAEQRAREEADKRRKQLEDEAKKQLKGLFGK